MGGFSSPVVASFGSTDPTAPLVVLLHGRGSNEQEIIGLADHLLPGPAYAAVRAPIADGGGFAWFANRGIGRPVTESLRATMDWFRVWLDGVAPQGRPVVVIGFSGGAAFAGGLILDDPSRFDGAGILYGTLPFDAGVPLTAARLAGLPVFVAQGEQDTVIPRELLERTWQYLTIESGAPTYARRGPGGHGITESTLAELGGWLAERLTFLRTRGRGSDIAPPWVGLAGGELPERARPAPGDPGHHPAVSALATGTHRPAGSAERPGRAARRGDFEPVGHLGARARGFVLNAASGPPDAFLVASAGEFAHLHPSHDGSLHAALPPASAADAVAKGWAVPHPLAGIRLTPGMVMVFGPRDDAELEIVAGVLATSHAWASGALTS